MGSLSEKFEVMVKQGHFDNEVMREALRGILKLEEIAKEKRRGTYNAFLALIASLSRHFFPEFKNDIAKLISRDYVVFGTSQKLVSKDVSPEGDGKDLETGDCVGCNSDDDELEDTKEEAKEDTKEEAKEDTKEEAKEDTKEEDDKLSADMHKALSEWDTTKELDPVKINLNNAKNPKQILAYFGNDESKLDEYLKVMEIESNASTPLGKAKKILKSIKK